MWVFTSNGFISIVQHRDMPNTMIVRGRVAKHLQALFPGQEVLQTKNSDYRYRAFLPREAVANALFNQALAVDYDNFKNSIPDAEYHDASLAVWGVMNRLQPGSYEHGRLLDPEDPYPD